MSHGSLNPKIRFAGQKVCTVAHVQTDRHTQTLDTNMNTEDTFQGFKIFSFDISSRIGPKSLRLHI